MARQWLTAAVDRRWQERLGCGSGRDWGAGRGSNGGTGGGSGHGRGWEGKTKGVTSQNPLPSSYRTSRVAEESTYTFIRYFSEFGPADLP